MNELNVFNMASIPEMFIGKEISGITLLELLGRGAMGLVYTGYQKSLKRKVAMKLFMKEGLSTVSIEKFRDEAETVAVLNHPNIVPVFDMGETDELLFIVMQLIDGEDLRSMIHRIRLHPVPSRRTIPIFKVIGIMIPVLDALSYAHRQQVIHQDIKPANIIIEKQDNRPYIVDFGIAKTIMSEPGISNIIQGTPLYMSPEQAAGQLTDARSDIYSAGILMYEAISGTLPVKKLKSEEMMKLKVYDPDSVFTSSPSQYFKSIDSELEKIICKAIASDPSKRYQSCSSFKDDLCYYAERFRGSVL